MRRSEPGGSVAVAIERPRAPGRWVVRPLSHDARTCDHLISYRSVLAFLGRRLSLGLRASPFSRVRVRFDRCEPGILRWPRGVGDRHVVCIPSVASRCGSHEFAMAIGLVLRLVAWFRSRFGCMSESVTTRPNRAAAPMSAKRGDPTSALPD